MQSLFRDRYLAVRRTFTRALALLGIGVLLALGPWSPVALRQAEALASMGDTEAACDLYGQIAVYGVSARLRGEAAYRGGHMAVLQLRDLDRGESLLRIAASDHRDSARRAEAHARLAGVYAREFQAGLRAADRWRLAATVSPDHPQAGDWLMWSAEAFEREDRHARASRIWNQIVQLHPDQSDDAYLAHARAALAQGHGEQAFALYSRVAGSDDGEIIPALGLLGMSLSIERKGGVELALAELSRARKLEAMKVTQVDEGENR